MRRTRKKLFVQFRCPGGKGLREVIPITVGTSVDCSIPAKGGDVPGLFALFIYRRRAKRYAIRFMREWAGWIGAPRPSGKGHSRCSFASLDAGGYLKKDADGAY